MRSMQRVMVAAGLAAAMGAGAMLGAAGRAEAQPVRSIGAVRIGTADVLGVVERMILSDRYKPAQAAFMKEQSDKLKPLADELQAMEARGAGLAQNSPDLEALTKQYDQKRDAFQQARAEAMQRIDAFNTDQVREAYKLTLAAVDEMATKQGYSHIVATRTGAALIRSDNVAGALQEILARPMAKSDPGDDLTDALIKQFKLEDVKVEAAPVQLGTPAGPGAPGAPPKK